MSKQKVFKCLASGLYASVGVPMLYNFAVSITYGVWGWHAPLFLYPMFFIIGAVQAWWYQRVKKG
jgi:hypothetical protein